VAAASEKSDQLFPFYPWLFTGLTIH